MSRTLLIAAAALLPLAVPAHASERAFTRDGVTYTYTVTPKGDATVIEGRATGGSRFHLVVRDGWVSGFSGTTRVSFRAPQGNSDPLAVAGR